MSEIDFSAEVRERRKHWVVFPPYRYAPRTVCAFEPFAILDMLHVNTKKGGCWSIHCRRNNGTDFMFVMPADEETRLAYERLARQVIDKPMADMCLVEKTPGVFRILTFIQKGMLIRKGEINV
jgi:hypothetical protein